LALAFENWQHRPLQPWVEVEDKSTLGRAALAEANTFRKRLWDWGLAETNVREFIQSGSR
jgi:hypothetical protein